MLALSGGNQQKVCLSRWMLRDVPLLLLDEPTVGIDVGARAEIHGLLRELAAAGTTIVVASAEPEELVVLCSRVIVLVEGEINAELNAPFETDNIVPRPTPATSEAPGGSPSWVLRRLCAHGKRREAL